MFPGRAELRPGKTPVAAGRAVAPGPRALCGPPGEATGRAGDPVAARAGPAARTAPRLCWCARAEEQDRGLLVLWKNLGGSSSCVPGPHRRAGPGRRPSPTCYAGFPGAGGSPAAPPPPGLNPRETADSRVSRARPGALLACCVVPGGTWPGPPGTIPEAMEGRGCSRSPMGLLGGGGWGSLHGRAPAQL